MKKKILVVLLNCIIIVVGLGLLAFILGPFARWNKKQPTTMNMWIIDKTVPNTQYREHTGLLWLLNSKKVISEKTKNELKYDEDYFGFFPININDYSIKDLPDEHENPDLIYLADTYGVYKDDYFLDNVKGTRSELIYGGLQDEELEKIISNLGNDHTIIGEFNTASAPTNRNNRDQLGDIFKIDWMGWAGRYFQDLSEGVEVPVWAVESFERRTGQEWKFYGEGIILVSDLDEVIVLESKKDLAEQYISLIFEDEYIEEYDVDKEVSYDYWFEFIVPNSSAQVMANYKLDLTEQGEKKLAEIGLPDVFPAIIRTNNTQYKSYYFAGDFADSDMEYKWWNYSGFAKIKRIIPMGEKGDNSKFFWRCYVPMMSKIVDDVYETKTLKQQEQQVDRAVKFKFRTVDDDFQIMKDGKWENFFSKGVNIGSSIPGTWFTQFSNDEKMYIDWFEKIGDMNANSIRIYTLLSPQFYNAFVYYNEQNPDKPLWLYQEIWPEEYPEDHDYLKAEYNEAYFKEIENVIDAMHGMANIPSRRGRAYGIYTSDVSPYIAGYLVGRELEPEEVEGTNERNEGYNYSGKYLYGNSNASPTEAWLAESCDYVLTYETDTYYWQHPVGIVSWPTLDPIEHDSEWHISGDKSKVYNDKISVDINNISTNDNLETGFFGAYHIYPNYPDFMNNETEYANYKDDQGVFRYGGYLKEFKENHMKYPALVAEFGIATGMGNAHSNPDGYNHGGLSQQVQGEGIVRMLKAMKKEDYAGGIIFEWSDEWAKKTWTTEPYMIPYDRNALWRNAVDPEQNYGILAMESADSVSEDYSLEGKDAIEEVRLMADETYLTVELTLKKDVDFDKENILIGFDTVDRDKGEFKYPNDNNTRAPFGLEFVVALQGENDAEILVQLEYNIHKGNYYPKKSFDGSFENMTSLINKEGETKSGEHIEPKYFDHSKLEYGVLDKNSYYNWYTEDKSVVIRLPWAKINVSDPSGMRVLYDEETVLSPLRDQINTTVTQGIMLSGIVVDKQSGLVAGSFGQVNQSAFTWDGWDVPKYEERLKESYYIISDYFENVD